MSLLTAFPIVHRLFARSRAVPLALVTLGVLAGCPKGDVGAPCNHGTVEPPQSLVTTFPAVTCNDLICIFPESPDIKSGDCDNDAACNNPGENRFVCNTARGNCEVAADYVLEKSMCSKKCSSDSDCKDGGPGKKVVDPDTSCAGNFVCRRIQAVGKFCCQKLCICEDDIGPPGELDRNCDSGVQDGCCRDSATLEKFVPPPEGCGPG